MASTPSPETPSKSPKSSSPTREMENLKMGENEKNRDQLSPEIDLSALSRLPPKSCTPKKADKDLNNDQSHTGFQPRTPDQERKTPTPKRESSQTPSMIH